MSRHPTIHHTRPTTHRTRTAYWVDSHLGDYFVSPSSPPSELSDEDWRPGTPSDNGSSHSDPPQMILRHVPGPDDANVWRYTTANVHGRHGRLQELEASTSRPRRHSTRSALSKPEKIRILPANHPIQQPHERARSTIRHTEASHAHAASVRERRHPVHTTARPPQSQSMHQVSHSYSHPSTTHMIPPANPRDTHHRKRNPGQIPTPATTSYAHRPPDHGYNGASRKRREGPGPILYTQSAPLPHQYRQHQDIPNGRASIDANDRYRSNRRRTLSSQTRVEEYLDRGAQARQGHKRTYTSDNIPQRLATHVRATLLPILYFTDLLAW